MAVRDFEGDPGLSIAVLTGAQQDLCTGMDLEAFSRGEAVGAKGDALTSLTRRATPVPIIAALEGYALAGGFEVALPRPRRRTRGCRQRAG